MRLGAAEGSALAQSSRGLLGFEGLSTAATDAASTSSPLTRSRPCIRLRIKNERRDEVGLSPAYLLHVAAIWVTVFTLITGVSFTLDSMPC